MIYFYVYVMGKKITHAEISDYEILSEGYHCLYHGTEEDLPDFLPKGVMTPMGGFIYALIDGEVVERSAEEIAADEEAANPTPSEPELPETGDLAFDEMAMAIKEGVNDV